MPKMPRFMVNAATSAFGKALTVTQVQEPAPHFRRVRMEGEAMRGITIRPGADVQFRVSESDLRHYTPCAYDAEVGAVEILFYIHGNGPGSQWAAGLSPGDEVSMLGPGGRMSLKSGAKSHVFFGDQSGVGLIEAMTRGLPGDADFIGAVELGEGETGILGGLSPKIHPRIAPAKPGDGLMEWLEEATLPLESAYYLVGNAGAISRVRKALMARGVSRRDIRTDAFWAENKVGL